VSNNNYNLSDAEAKILRQYLKEISKTLVLSLEEELELAEKYRKYGDEESLEKLIVSNLRYVVTIAKKFKAKGMSILDLINEGNAGLIVAARRFDPKKKGKLIGYAKWWIIQSIERAIQNQGSSIRLPAKKTSLYSDILKVKKEMQNLLQREPTTDELTEEMKIDKEDYEKVVQARNVVLSFDDPLLQDGDSELRLEDVLVDNNPLNADDLVMRNARKEILKKSLNTLTEKERAVIILRFGLEDGKELTLSEVGKILKLSRERVRQLEQSALKKLKMSKMVSDLLGYLN
jgi:RNA polymerase primary sigma factor